MTMLKTPNLESPKFVNYLFRKDNLFYFISSFIIAIVLWLFFKHYYPHPNIIWDSYHYLNATVSNADVNAWPIGYSWFVYIIGQFSHSPTFLITFQYFFLNISILIFFFTLRFLFNLNQWPSILLFLFLFFNPIYLFTSNLILSDTLFTALSILWITNIIWFFISPRYWMIFTHALIILVVFTIRYNALYYPIAATIAFLLVKKEAIYKWMGIFLQFFLIGSFILFTTVINRNLFGVSQFSPFGGWKLANDALYMYKHVYKDSKDVIPERFLPLERHVRRYFDTQIDTVDLFTPDPTSGSYYMYIHPSPLLTYRDSLFGETPSALDLNTFSRMGPLYQDYGSWLILRQPIAFTKYFIWPNIQRYFISPPEVYTDDYNPFSLRTDSLGAAAIKWFKLSSISAKRRPIEIRHSIFMSYPVLNIIIHMLFILTYISFLLIEGFKKLDSASLRVIITIGILWLFDFGFNITAAAVVLRYQLFISIIEFSFALIFLSRIIYDKDVNKEIVTC